MTNAEKYLKDDVDIKKFINDFVKYRIYHKGIFSASTLLEFLQEQAKITLTENERVILRNINKEARIWREKGKLWIYCEGNLFNEDIFQFIKERGRI